MKVSIVVLCLMLGVVLAAGPANTPVSATVVNDVNPAAQVRAPYGPFGTMDVPPTVEWTFNCEFDSVYNVGVTAVQDSLCWVSAGQTTLAIGIYNIADTSHPYRTSFAQTGGPSGWGIRDMAYKASTDEVFAGFDNQTYHVYNATTHAVNNTYTISGYTGTVRGMAYSPIEDSCWTCNFTDSPMAKFSITGTNGHLVKAAAQMGSAYGLALDTNQHCFWMSSGGVAGASPFWKIDYPGYTVSDSFNPVGWDLGGGCEMWGDTFLLALEQATPDLIWCFRFAPVGVEEGSKINAGSSHMAYPTLARDLVRISYSLSKSARVNLSIYDASGVLVRTLVDGTVSPGARTATWNRSDESGRRVASGTYSYRLSVDGKSVSGKTVILQ